jgi:hypothetical protein
LENSDKERISVITGFDGRLAIAEQAVYTFFALLTRDTRPGSPLRGVNNRVTDTAGALRVFKELCIQIRAQLDRTHQKE